MIAEVKDTAVVVHLTDHFGYFLAFLLIHADDLTNHREITPDASKLHSQVALRVFPTGGDHVHLAGTPHQADHLVQREAVLAKLADGNGRRLAEQMRHHPLGPHAARDVQDRGGHLDARRRHGKLAAAVPFLLADAPKNAERLAPGGVVVIDVRNLAARRGALVP